MTMRRILLASGLALLLSGLASCGGGGGGSPTASAPSELSERLVFPITSSNTNMQYNVNVYLPVGYHSGSARYPVIYAADAESRFAFQADLLDRQRRPAILVNVWAMGGGRRWVDFTMPGAEAYYKFITQELIPRIDAQYRTDPSHRTYNGHSLSGEFTLYALYLDRAGQRYFKAFIAEEASLWYGPDMRFSPNATNADPATRMEAEMFARERSLPVTLVMAGDTTSNGPRVREMHDFLAARGYENLRITHRSYSLGHVGMDALAFEEALAFVFGPP